MEGIHFPQLGFWRQCRVFEGVSPRHFQPSAGGLSGFDSMLINLGESSHWLGLGEVTTSVTKSCWPSALGVCRGCWVLVAVSEGLGVGHLPVSDREANIKIKCSLFQSALTQAGAVIQLLCLLTHTGHLLFGAVYFSENSRKTAVVFPVPVNSDMFLCWIKAAVSV